ncbi:glutathione S-transferase N-terminal domain-containing protein, partial [Pseudomonas sp. SIMBA_068]
NKSRSKRIIWLLEELEVNYEIVAYQRNKDTFLAPDELKQVHQLGKSPVIEDDGLIVTESGAITDYLITKYGNGKFA